MQSLARVLSRRSQIPSQANARDIDPAALIDYYAEIGLPGANGREFSVYFCKRVPGALQPLANALPDIMSIHRGNFGARLELDLNARDGRLHLDLPQSQASVGLRPEYDTDHFAVFFGFGSNIGEPARSPESLDIVAELRWIELFSGLRLQRRGLLPTGDFDGTHDFRSRRGGRDNLRRGRSTGNNRRQKDLGGTQVQERAQARRAVVREFPKRGTLQHRTFDVAP